MKQMRQPALGARLKRLRLASGLSQGQLAGEGMSQSYVSHIESGRREPTERALETLARRLSVTVADLTADLTGVGPVEVGTEVLLGQADVEVMTGLLADATGKYRLVLGLADPKPQHRQRATLGLAEVLEREGDLDGAVRLLQPLSRELRTGFAADGLAEDQDRLASVSTALSRCYREAGDLQRAVEVAEAAVDVLDVLRPRPQGHAQLVATLAYAYTERGDLLTAGQLLEDLLAEYEDGQDRSARAAVYWNASLVNADRGRTADSLRMIEKAHALLAEQEDDRALARIKITQAWILMSQPIPDPRRAQGLLETAVPELRRHGTATDVASARTELARVALVCDRPLDAIAHARAALAALPAQPNSEKARARAALGEAFIALGDQASGLAELNSAAETLTEVGSSREAAQVWRQLAELYAALNAASQALAAYAHAMDAVGVRGDALDRRLQHAIQVGPASSGAGPDDEARQPARA